MSDNSTSSGIGFGGMLTILFIALKLMGYINWSWIWVLCPMWIPFAIIIALWVIGIIAGLINW